MRLHQLKVALLARNISQLQFVILKKKIHKLKAFLGLIFYSPNNGRKCNLKKETTQLQSVTQGAL